MGRITYTHVLGNVTRSRTPLPCSHIISLFSIKNTKWQHALIKFKTTAWPDSVHSLWHWHSRLLHSHSRCAPVRSTFVINLYASFKQPSLLINVNASEVRPPWAVLVNWIKKKRINKREKSGQTSMIHMTLLITALKELHQRIPSNLLSDLPAIAVPSLVVTITVATGRWWKRTIV